MRPVPRGPSVYDLLDGEGDSVKTAAIMEIWTICTDVDDELGELR